jgi:hypothetical protein
MRFNVPGIFLFPFCQSRPSYLRLFSKFSRVSSFFAVIGVFFYDAHQFLLFIDDIIHQFDKYQISAEKVGTLSIL